MLAQAWVRFLMQIPGMSEPRATAVARVYPSLHALRAGYLAHCSSATAARNFLQDIPIQAASAQQRAANVAANLALALSSGGGGNSGGIALAAAAQAAAQAAAAVAAGDSGGDSGAGRNKGPRSVSGGARLGPVLSCKVFETFFSTKAEAGFSDTLRRQEEKEAQLQLQQQKKKKNNKQQEAEQQQQQPVAAAERREVRAPNYVSVSSSQPSRGSSQMPWSSGALSSSMSSSSHARARGVDPSDEEQDYPLYGDDDDQGCDGFSD
jgi:hypothetical protein